MADRHLIDVHLLLVGDGRLLLTRRRDTNPIFDGWWHLPSGKLDADESVLGAAAREAEEEVGVQVQPNDLHHVHTLHVNGSGPEPRLGLFFESRRWIGEPTNREPGKCSAVRWFRLDALPDQLIDYPAAGIRAYRAGVSFSVHGWTSRPRKTGPLASERTGWYGDGLQRCGELHHPPGLVNSPTRFGS
jgi:8-oxo-dGTP diphosphatase